MENKLNKREGENHLSYAKRITLNKKELDLDYTEWCKLVCNKEYSSDNARKAFYIFKPFLELVDEENISKMPQNKIDEIVDVLGELDVKKIEVKNRTNQLNKIKKDLVKNVEIARYLEEYIDREVANFQRLDYEKIIDKSDKKLIIGISDFHVGYVINGYKGNYYNYEIAKLRLSKLLSEINTIIKDNDITNVIVAQAGDLTEGTYMRKSQAYECEFNSNEQVVMAEELLYGFITSISEMEVNVDVYSVGGNHQRGNGDKDANLEGDNNNFVVVRNLKKWFALAENDRVNVHDIDFKDDSIAFKVDEFRVKLLHGDNRTNDKKRLYDSEASMDDCRYDLIIRGHDHNFNVTSQNNGGYVLTIGCLFGYNPYSVKKMQCTTNASQCLILVNNNKIEYIKDVNLQIV